MMTLKISCTQCSQHSGCPYRTQFFVNYCGAEQKKLAQAINSAVSECRSRRGQLLKKAIGFYTAVSPAVSIAVPS